MSKNAKISNFKTNTVVQSATSVLDALVASLPATKPTSKGKSDKWIIKLNENGQEVFKRWIEAKILSEPVLQRMENSKDFLNDICLQEFTEKFYECKNRPSNPQLVCMKGGKEDCTATWIFTDKFKVRLPEIQDGQDAKTIYIAAFCELGLHAFEAEKLVDNELIINPVIGVRPLNDLLNGHFEKSREFIPASDIEKSAGLKLASFLTARTEPIIEPLTDEERQVMIDRNDGVSVRTGFLERVCNYARSSIELLAIFKLLQPVVYPSHAKFAVNDNPIEQNNRKISAAANILGVEVA